MICDPMYMMNINYKSHSTLPENLNINAESWALQMSNNKAARSLCLALSSQHPNVLPFTHTLHHDCPHLPPSVLCEEDPLGLNPDYHDYIYLSVFAPGACLLSLLLTAYTSLENPKSSQTPLSRAACSNLSVSTIFNYSLLLTAIPNPALLWQRKCFRIPYITCQASSKRVHF